MRYLLIALLLTLTGCITAPNLETGEGCWRYKVLEDGNTGRMTAVPIESIKVVRLSYDELQIACGKPDNRSLAQYYRDKRTVTVRACFKPRAVDGKDGEDVIYLHKQYAGAMELFEEQCHARLGRLHNSCTGYGIGKDESACNWNQVTQTK